MHSCIIITPIFSFNPLRFNSYEECHGNHCEDMGYKEHFHCLDCSFRVGAATYGLKYVAVGWFNCEILIKLDGMLDVISEIFC